MKQVLFATLLLASLAACGAPPTPAPTETPTREPPTATPKPPMAAEIGLCGYGDFGWVTMAGTLTNNTDSPYTFVTAVVALVKNGQVVRTDEVYLANATGVNTAIIDGLDLKPKTGGLASDETWAWSIAYPFEKLTQPCECEVSVTDFR